MYVSLDLGFSNEFEEDKITIEQRKEVGKILKHAREQAKLKTCFYCKKRCDGFCKSHTVPQFILKNIAKNGKLYYANTILKSPLQKEEKGIAEAGVFYIICNDCDSSLFREYENPTNYKSIPSSKMLAEIDLKNILKSISKRIIEKEAYKYIHNNYGDDYLWFDIASKQINNIKIDLTELGNSFRIAKNHISNLSDSNYYMGLYEELPFTVPIAYQGQIALIVDLEGNLINMTYSPKASTKIETMNLCIFPLEDKTIIMAFVEKKNEKYKRFFKQLRGKCLDEKITIINYILFLYTEDFFISPLISSNVLDRIKDTYKITNSGFSINEGDDINRAFEIEKRKYSLQNIPDIPVLLDKKYEICVYDTM